MWYNLSNDHITIRIKQYKGVRMRSKSTGEQVTEFLKKCEQLKKSKFIMATTRIKDLLKSIVNSPALYAVFQAATSRFDYVSAKRRCFVASHEGFYDRGRLVLPENKGERLAFIFCLLVEFDHDTINFNEFLLKFFPEDGGYYASFRSFCNAVINSMEDILREVFCEELGIDPQSVVNQSAQAAAPVAYAAPRTQSAAPSVNYYGPAAYDAAPVNSYGAAAQNASRQAYGAPSEAYAPSVGAQQYASPSVGQAAYAGYAGPYQAQPSGYQGAYGRDQSPAANPYGAARPYGSADPYGAANPYSAANYSAENDIYSPLPTHTVTSFGITVPAPSSRQGRAQQLGGSPWLQSAPVQGVNVYGSMPPRPVPGASQGEKLSAISMLIAYERDIIDRSLMTESEKQDGMSMLNELESAVRESRPNAVYALLRGYEYYSACHNNFSQLSIMLRSTLGG